MEISRPKIILKYKMLNLDDIVSNKKENKDHNWPLAIVSVC